MPKSHLYLHDAYFCSVSPPQNILKQMAQAVTLLTRTREVFRFILGQNTDYPEDFRRLPQSLQVNAGESNSNEASTASAHILSNIINLSSYHPNII
jgi:hypothetical protein